MRIPWLVALAVALAPLPDQDRSMPAIDLKALEPLGEFTLTVEGPALESFPSKRACVYFEWAAGDKRNGRWATRVAGTHSGNTVVAVTPRGRIELPHGMMRLYLPASASHRYVRTNPAAAPEIVRPHLGEFDAVVLEEYVLEAGRRYHARVDVESYLLPPDPGGAPERRQNLVLAMSDVPFKGGKAQRQLAPSFVGIVY